MISGKSIMELYMLNRQHGRMILESVENGPLIWPSIEENGVTRPRNILSYLLQKQFKLIVISRQQTSFSKGYNLGLTLQELVEAILGNKGRLPATTAKGKKSSLVETKAYKLCDIIDQTNPIEILTQKNLTLAEEEESRSKMFLKHKDNMMLEKEKQVDTTPIDALNQLYKDFSTRFVPQTELSAEQAVEQHRIESKTFEVNMNQVLNQNERLLEQVMSRDIVNLLVNSSVDNDSVNVHECQKYLQLETELQTNFVKRETYDKLFKSFTILEKHCISLEVDTQLKQKIFQRENSISNQSVLSFDQLYELNELKAQSQEKDTVIKKLKERIKSLSGKIDKDKIKQDLEEIETINIELDHREKALAITTLKDELRKLKGKALVDNNVSNHPSDPELHQVNVEPITPKLLNKRTAHSAYIKHSQEEAAVLKDLVDHIKANYSLDPLLESACKYTKLIEEMLSKISKTCPSTLVTLLKTKGIVIINELELPCVAAEADLFVQYVRYFASHFGQLAIIFLCTSIKTSYRRLPVPQGSETELNLRLGFSNVHNEHDP
ncbi:hypothetical protein Tco_0921801 [Tanacetum coccineum]